MVSLLFNYGNPGGVSAQSGKSRSGGPKKAQRSSNFFDLSDTIKNVNGACPRPLTSYLQKKDYGPPT